MTTTGLDPITEYSPRVTEILDALENLILDEGFRGLRLTEVAKSLSTSYATLYKIAPSKEELVLLIIERWYRRAHDETEARLATIEDPVERLVFWVENGVELGGRPTPAFYADVASHEVINARADAVDLYWNRRFEQLLVEAIDAGAIRPINAEVLAITVEAAAPRHIHPERLAAIGGRTVLSLETLDVLLYGILPREAEG